MDFFGFGTSSDLSTPLGQVIKSATESLQLGPDWTKNLDICDQISHTREGVDHATKAIYRRLSDNDANTVYLTLILVETCMKNCGPSFVGGIDKSIMDLISNIAKGSKGEKCSFEALRLIQQWGRAYERKRSVFPIFFDTYVALKAKGAIFPPEDSSSAAGLQSASATGNGTAKRPSGTDGQLAPQNIDEFARLESDLMSVMDKVTMCREMLLVSPGIDEDETLADVIGFLEAVRDRMVDLIDAGTQGVLGEEIFALCLKVNEAVYRTLEAEKTGTYIAVNDDSSQNISSGEQQSKVGEKTASTTDNLLDLSFPLAPVAAKQGGSAIVAPPLAPTPAKATTSTAAADFDDFLSGFTSNAPPIATPQKQQQLPQPQPTTQASATPFDDFLAPAAPPASATVGSGSKPGASTDKDALDAFFNEKW